MTDGFSSLVDVLRHRALTQPDERAYVFLADRGGAQSLLSFGELDRRARVIGTRLAALGRPGDRALLLFPPGLEFVEAFFGCLYAGIVAVPMIPPRRDRLREAGSTIAADCAPRVCLTTSSLRQRLQDDLAGRPGLPREWLTVDGAAPQVSFADADLPRPRREDLAFLQYTSGSTSAPKGVMVSHRNVLANLELIRGALGTTRQSTYVNWVPLYHDMGLILNVLQACYVGAVCVLMAPVTFMQRPLDWLRAIHEYRAEVAGAPNFAFDLCVARFRPEQLVGLDLSSWKIAFNGAEPVHPETLERFVSTYAPYGLSPKAVYPCYGLAEATVLVSAGSRGAGPVAATVSRDGLARHRVRPPRDARDARTVPGCGRTLPGQRLAVVDPTTRRPLGPDEVGEIWIAGPSVTRGYWCKPAETVATFEARLEGDDDLWLRSGDLGFMDATGELYVTGRLKDVIIVRGANHYPQDIERTVGHSHTALRAHSGAAFVVVDENGADRLVVVHEVEPSRLASHDLADVVARIRAAVVREHELTIHHVVLLRPGAIPKTSSGKNQRRLTQQRWREGTLDIWGAVDEGLGRAEPVGVGAAGHPEAVGDDGVTSGG